MRVLRSFFVILFCLPNATFSSKVLTLLSPKYIIHTRALPQTEPRVFQAEGTDLYCATSTLALIQTKPRVFKPRINNFYWTLNFPAQRNTDIIRGRYQTTSTNGY